MWTLNAAKCHWVLPAALRCRVPVHPPRATASPLCDGALLRPTAAAPSDSVCLARRRTSPTSCRCRLPGRPLISAHPRYPATPMFSRHNIEEVRRPRTADGRICGKCGRTSRLFRQATTHISDIMPRVRGGGRISEMCADPRATKPAPAAGYRGSALIGGATPGGPGRLSGKCAPARWLGTMRPAAAAANQEFLRGAA